MTELNSAIINRLCMAFVVIALAIASWLPTLDNLANEQIDAGMTRSLASFATARALNAAISVAQGTETAFQPVGIGVVLTPGQVLDPINDLVEKFSNLMLMASIAFGVEKVLIEIGGTILLPILICLLSVFWVYYHIRGKAASIFVTRALLILLVIRFAVPVMTVGTDWLFEHFMANRYESSQQFLAHSSEGLPATETPVPKPVPPPKADDEKSWYQLWDAEFSFPSIDIPDSPVQKVQQKMAEGVRHIIDLMVIFVLQVLVLPVLILWVIYTTVKRLVES